MPPTLPELLPEVGIKAQEPIVVNITAPWFEPGEAVRKIADAVRESAEAFDVMRRSMESWTEVTFVSPPVPSDFARHKEAMLRAIADGMSLREHDGRAASPMTSLPDMVPAAAIARRRAAGNPGRKLVVPTDLDDHWIPDAEPVWITTGP